MICHPSPLTTAPRLTCCTPYQLLKSPGVLSSSLAKSSTMDIIPTSLLVCCKVVFSEIIAHLANLTLFKQASVTPVIKGQSLDKSVPSNYRPISNLNVITKILERLFLFRFKPHILTPSNFNKYQSAC